MIWLILHNQVAENILEAEERGLWKMKGGSCLNIHLYYGSVDR